MARDGIIPFYLGIAQKQWVFDMMGAGLIVFLGLGKIRSNLFDQMKVVE